VKLPYVHEIVNLTIDCVSLDTALGFESQCNCEAVNYKMLKSLTIFGLRGFADQQTVEFAKPTGELGSGLTMIVGANNSGKSTAIEALRALTQNTPPSFTQGRRNQRAGDRVELSLVDDSGDGVKLESQFPGTSETHRTPDNATVGRRDGELFVLPSRRVFNPYFSRGRSSRVDYSNQTGFPVLRSATIDGFTNRLFTIQNNRADFDAVMKKVLDPVPDWSIDQTDTGQYYLKIKRGDAFHSSEGLGEGLVSLIYIIDALYDSKQGQMIAIDEPELSLHPALQRKLAVLLAEYARDRQIAC
jgi:energy-coupling factor transporter ATP-binding protein EcfA2